MPGRKREVRRALVVATAAAAAVALGGCGGEAPKAARPATVWLCRPGLAGDPCTSDETATVVGARGVLRRRAGRSPPRTRRLTASTSIRRSASSRHQRQPPHRPAGARGRDRAGLALLAGLPRLRADLPAADPARAHRAGRDHAEDGDGGLRRAARELQGLPRALQPRSRHRLHRALAGGLPARRAAGARRRPGCGAAAPARVGAAARGQRDGRRRRLGPRRLRPHPPVPRGAAVRLRRGLLELRGAAARRCALRSPRRRARPVHAAGARERERALRQPRLAARR